MAYRLNGKNLPLNKAFTTADGTQYPRNWLTLSTPAEREAIGIVEVVNTDTRTWDQRYYWGQNQDGELIPKQLEDETVTPEDGEPYTQIGLKTQHINQTKETANTLLAPTDWYVVRKFERDVDIPVGIVSFRASVLEVSAQRENLIGLTTSVAELKGLYESSHVGIGTEEVVTPPAMPEWPSTAN